MYAPLMIEMKWTEKQLMSENTPLALEAISNEYKLQELRNKHRG